MKYEIAKPSDSDEMVDLLARVFSESEPPAVAMALSFDEMRQFLQPLVPEVVGCGLSVVSRNTDTRKLSGVLFTDDLASPPKVDVRHISPKFLPIFSMLETLDEQFRYGRSVGRGEYLHLFMLAVAGQFAGQGIGQSLIMSCIENGCRQGYHTALTEATGKVSQHIFRKSGFVDRFSVSYQDFTYEKKAVFASIRKHEKAILMDRPLV